jgi:glycosyltransferase involved in cell wall biosynthesis
MALPRPSTSVAGPRSAVPGPSTLDPQISPGPSTLDPRPSLPLVTIAIPTYNRADSYLPQALECAFDQTYANLEIIVADNCSTDNTRAIVNGIADPRLRYFRHEVNIGSTNNVNFCLEQATGEYVLFLHDDDRIDPDFVESCIRAANDISDIGLIRTGMRWIDRHDNVCGEALNRVGGLSFEGFLLGWFTGKTPMHPCSTLFNTKRLKAIGGFHSKNNLYDDVIAEVKLAAKHNRVDIPDVKASFRHHPNRLSTSQQIASWCEDSLILLDTMCSLVPASKVAFVRSEGVKFFVRDNYCRAFKITSFFSRLSAYGTILEYFNYRIVRFISMVVSLAVSRRTAVVKKKIIEILERAPSLKARIMSFRKCLSGSQQ